MSDTQRTAEDLEAIRQSLVAASILLAEYAFALSRNASAEGKIAKAARKKARERKARRRK